MRRRFDAIALHWQAVPENLRMGLKMMLDKCTDEELDHRYADFEPVLKVLEGLVLAYREEAGREQGAEDTQSKQERLRRVLEESDRKRQEEQVEKERQQELARQEQERQRREQEQAERKRQDELARANGQEQEEKKRQQELARLQEEGEQRLTQFVQEVFSRTQGKPTKEDNAPVKDCTAPLALDQ